MTEGQHRYITMEDGWTPKLCPFCKQREAIAHGWLFRDPPCPPPQNKRDAVGEVFMHSDHDDCVRVGPGH